MTPPEVRRAALLARLQAEHKELSARIYALECEVGSGQVTDPSTGDVTPECPGPECPRCDARDCMLCGDGPRVHGSRCEHDTTERHGIR